MARKKLNKKTGLTFLERLLGIAGNVVVTILENKNRSSQGPVELTPEQVKGLNELL